jgi:hypothetical protein
MECGLNAVNKSSCVVYCAEFGIVRMWFDGMVSEAIRDWSGNALVFINAHTSRRRQTSHSAHSSAVMIWLIMLVKSM